MDPLTLIGAGISAITSLIGGSESRASNERIAAQNIANQRDFAQHGLGWRIDDAVAHGLSPLVGAGAQPGPSFSNIVGDSSMGESIGRAGQELGRAVGALGSKDDKLEQLNTRLLELKIKAAEGDITHQQLLNSKLATDLQVGTPGIPGIPFPTPDPRGPVRPLTQRFRTDDGEIVYLPSAEASQSAQNLFAAPGGVPMAVDLLRQNTRQAGRDLSSWYAVRPDLWRGVDTSQYAPF